MLKKSLDWKWKWNKIIKLINNIKNNFLQKDKKQESNEIATEQKVNIAAKWYRVCDNHTTEICF